MEQKQIILDFIRKQKLAVISTVGVNGKPESAALEFGETNDLELIIDTFTSSRKYKNIQTNNQVAFVIGWDDDITVQYEGLAEEVVGDSAKRYKEAYWRKNPEAKRWDSREGIAYIKVKPTWIRYSDLNKDPWEVFEVNL